MGKDESQRAVSRMSPPSGVFGRLSALTLIAAAAVATLACMSAFLAPSASAARARTAPDANLRALTQLRNYAFIYTAVNGGAKLRSVGFVHSPTDWKLVTGSVTAYDVGGHGYATVRGLPQVQRRTFRTAEGYTSLNGEHTWGAALVATTRVTGIRVARGRACTVAGRRGTIYVLRSPSDASAIFSLVDQACVADQGGALLYYGQGITGGKAAAAVHLVGAQEQFEVTRVGRVGVIRAPR